ncbi:MAG: cell division protein FtsQ/DivIB [Curvibacter sp.]|jgi:cell division protein FtsQ
MKMLNARGPTLNHPAALPMDVRLMNLTATLLLLGFVLLALATGGRWLAHHPFFAIRGLTVLGDISHTSALTLRAQVAPQLKGTFLTVDLNAVRLAFEGLPWVRRAVVQREFPNRLRVILQEHQPVAYWGEEGESTLVNSFGEVFEANLGEVEQDELPKLDGPVERSAEVLSMHRTLQPMFDAIDLPIERLVLSSRGNWQITLQSGARLELGSGGEADITARVKQFLGTVAQVAAHHGRKLDALEGADLRYAQGYALRLRGVSTVAADAAARN